MKLNSNIESLQKKKKRIEKNNSIRPKQNNAHLHKNVAE